MKLHHKIIKIKKAMFTAAQQTTIAQYLATNQNVVLFGNKTVLENMNASNYDGFEKYFNKKNVANTKIWKPDVERDSIINAIDFTEFITLTAAKRDAAVTFLACNVFDFTIAKVRSNVEAIFTAGSATDTAIKAKGDRIATNLELLFTVNGVSEVFGYQISREQLRAIFSEAKQII